MPMLATAKTKWIQALNSGLYQPGIKYDMILKNGTVRPAISLRDGDLWSALGVLVDALQPDIWDMTLPKPHLKKTAYIVYGPAKITSAQLLEILTMQINDKTFPEIATFIQNNVKY